MQRYLKMGLALGFLVFMTACSADIPDAFFGDTQNAESQTDTGGPPCTPGVDCPIPADAETGDAETGDAETGDAETGDAETGDADSTDVETGDETSALCADDDECIGVFGEVSSCQVAKCTEGGCVLDVRPDGWVCAEAEDMCEEDSICDAGVCNPGNPKESCFPCETKEDCPNAQLEDKCAMTLDCVEGVCEWEEGSAVVCDTSMDEPCKKKTCDSNTGECVLMPLGTSEFCEHNDPCVLTAACNEGNCKAKTTKDCGAPDPDTCVSSICNSETGNCEDVITKGKGDPCNDGDLCTENDSCDANGECAGWPMECEDNGCISEICDPAQGLCVVDQAQPDFTPCDDKDESSLGDWCQAGECVAFQFVDDWSSTSGSQDFDEPDAFIDGTVTNTNLIHGMARYQKDGDIKHKVSIWDGQNLCCATSVGTNLDSHAMDGRYLTTDESLRGFSGEVSDGWGPISDFNESLAEAWGAAINPTDWTAIVSGTVTNFGQPGGTTEVYLVAMGPYSVGSSTSVRECSASMIGFFDPIWSCPAISWQHDMCDGVPTDGVWFDGGAVFVCHHEKSGPDEMRLLTKVELNTGPVDEKYDSVLSLALQDGQSPSFIENGGDELLVGGTDGFLAVGTTGGMTLVSGIFEEQSDTAFTSAVIHNGRWLVLGYYEKVFLDVWVILHADGAADLSLASSWSIHNLQAISGVIQEGPNGPTSAGPDTHAYNKLLVDGNDNLWLLGGRPKENTGGSPNFYMKKAIWKYGL